MLHLLELNIAEHLIVMEVPSDTLYTWAVRAFCAVPATSYTFASPIDLILSADLGFGQPFNGKQTQISFSSDTIQYLRSDFLIVASRDYSEATIKAHDTCALNQALMTLYSALITYRKWGLTVQASCWIEDGHAFLLAHSSDYRLSKSTDTPYPHTLLSDAAALLKVSDGRVRVFNSPFRCDSFRNPQEMHLSFELRECHLFRPSINQRRIQLNGAESVSRLLPLLAYQAPCPLETAKLVTMCQAAVRSIPCYELLGPDPDSFRGNSHIPVYEASV